MNWKQIIRAAFDLTDEEWDQAVKLRELSETERELLTSALGPQKPAAKKSSNSRNKRCVAELLDGSTCKMVLSHGIHDEDNQGPNAHEFLLSRSSKKAGKKSQRAQSLGDQIQRRPRGVVTGDDSDNDGPCTRCTEDADHNSHHKRTDPDYHPFTPAASSAPPPSDQASSEIGKADVSSAAQGAGGGG